MAEKDLLRQPGSRRPEDNVFDWFLEAWRKRYAAAETEGVDREAAAQEVLGSVCEENCLDPIRVTQINEAAHLAVRAETALKTVPPPPEASQAS